MAQIEGRLAVKRIFSFRFAFKCIVCSMGVILLLSCGGSTPDNFNGTWLWTEQGVPLYTKVTANIEQTGSDITGVTVENNASQQCAVSGTVSGHAFDGNFGAPCNQAFSVTLSPDKRHLQGVLNGSGVVVTATKLPSS